MVKRKKIGFNLAEDEKNQDEGMTVNINAESGKTGDTSLESNNLSQQVNVVRNRVHSTRTATKESQNLQDSHASDSLSQEKCAKPLATPRCSNRVPKRARKDESSTGTSLKKTAIKQNIAPDGSKTRRPWELWSVEDKNAFFEALCEYGKDFENIQSYIAQRSKKKGISANMIKNKDQVRHFYYRTWHKISKYLDIGEDVRKQAQELYGLINYAELRKKIGSCLNVKNSQKLNELVFNGVTTIKFKGKKMRIKTPVCRALKKLNNVAEPKVPVVEKLPKEIMVEFRPSTNEAWLQVQNLAQNPRVRTKLCLQRRLKTVIEYLEKRWKPYRLKKKEQVMSSLPQSADPSLFDDPQPVLRVKPRKDSTISLLTISVMDNASSSDVCLEKYMKHFVQEIVHNETVKVKKGRLKPKPPPGPVVSTPSCPIEKPQENAKRDNESHSKLEPCAPIKSSETSSCTIPIPLPTESCLEDLERVPSEESFSVGILTPPKSVPEQDQTENLVNEAERSLSLLKSMLCPVEEKSPETERNNNSVGVCGQDLDSGNVTAPECRTIEEMYLNTQQDSENMTLGQLLGMGSEKHPPSPDVDTEKIVSLSTNSGENKNVDANTGNSVSGCDLSQTLRDVIEKGWNARSADLLTIGELYLMLGRPSKIVLEYEWEHPVIYNKTLNGSVPPITLQPSNSIDSVKQQSVKLAEILRKLTSVASATFAEFKSKQQNPLSPPARNTSATRMGSTPAAVSKPGSRASPKNSNIKANVKAKCANANEKILKDSSTVQNKTAEVASAGEPNMSNSEKCLAAASAPTNLTPAEKNFFVVPVGTAPRAVKHPTQESLREEIDKLLPGTRRGCRVRRKPLVVQRTLLPREGMNAMSNARPMAVVHLVPSVSQLSSLATVIPSSCSSSENKIALPTNKSVVKILSTGSAIDMRPLQVPILNSVNTDTSRKVILQSSNLSTTHLMMTSAPPSAIHVLDNSDVSQSNLPTINNSVTVSVIENIGNHSVLVQPSISSQTPLITTDSTIQSSPIVSHPLSSLVDAPNLTTCTVIASKTTSSLPTISIPDPTITTSSLPTISIPDPIMASTSAVSPTSISTLMELPLPESLPSEPIAELAGEQLLDFGDNSNISVSFGLSPAKTLHQASQPISPTMGIDVIDSSKSCNSPQRSPSRKFRISSPGPEAQWLNGESIEVSFNTLLNTLETPCKVLPSSTMSSSADNSNLDPIVRLAPVVDSQVRCLLDECSVDFIAKFEDLADVINSSVSDNKST